MSRIVDRMRSQPRVYARAVDVQMRLLTDTAWILREVKQSGSVDGTPNYLQTPYGPYRALLGNPTWNEQRQADRYQIGVTHTIAIASDVVPLISDLVQVTTDELSSTAAQNNGLVRVFRITGDVQRRRAKFGSVMVYHALLAELEED